MHRRFARFAGGAAAAVGLVALTLTPASAIGPSGDPAQSQQWGLQKIGAATAWGGSTGKGQIVGIIDTGVDLKHEDLKNKVLATANCLGSRGDEKRCITGGGQDDNGHGTHVSGIVAAETGNGKGIAGVAPDAKLVVAKVLEADGSGGTDDINAGIAWAIAEGASVINLSLAGNFLITNVLGNPITNGIEYAWEKGAVPVLASGNERMLFLGASQNYGNLHAIVVGATDSNDKLASYSSSLGNAQWGMAAPGGDGAADAQNQVLSTFWDGKNANAYMPLAGTSMAAPHVAGAVAALLAKGLTQQQAVDRVLATAAPVPCGTNCKGRLDMAKAVGSAAPATSATAAGTSGSASATGGGGSSSSSTGATIAGGARPTSTTARGSATTAKKATGASPKAATGSTLAGAPGAAGATGAPGSAAGAGNGSAGGSATVPDLEPLGGDGSETAAGTPASSTSDGDRSTGLIALAVGGALLLFGVGGAALRRSRRDPEVRGGAAP